MKITKNLFRALAGLLVIGFSSCTDSSITDQANILAFTEAHIIDVSDGSILKNMTVLVEEDGISQVGLTTEVKIPGEASIISARGKYIIPGLWDMHVHTSSESNTRNILYPTFIANGITGIRVMSADCFEPCWELGLNIEKSIKIREDVAQGKQIGPRAMLASNPINGAKPGEESTVQDPGTKEHGRELVHLLINRGVDFLKVYDELPREAYFGIAAEANKQGIPFAGHVPVAIKASEASDAGQKSIEHCCAGSLLEECSSEEKKLRALVVEAIHSREPENMNKLVLQMVKTYDEAKCRAVFDKFLKNNTWYVPTLLAGESDQLLRTGWRTDDRLKYVPKNEAKWWSEDEINTGKLYGPSFPEIRKKRFEIVQEMNQAGVNLLAGSDCGIFGAFWGSGLHDELSLLVEAGLTELEALQAATINAAEYANRSDSLGKVKEGMLADLLILDSNPLENIRNTRKINAVISNGRYFDRERLNTLLYEVAAAVEKQ